MKNHDKLQQNSFKRQNNLAEQAQKIASLCKGHVVDNYPRSSALSNTYAGSYDCLSINGLGPVREDVEAAFGHQFIDVKHKDINPEYYKNANTVIFELNVRFILDATITLHNIFNQLPQNCRVIFISDFNDCIEEGVLEFNDFYPKVRAELSKFGHVKFYNHFEEKTKIIATVDRGLYPKNELTLAMIVKDEAKGLEHAILSSLEIVDKIFINVDSQSSDNTFQIAKKYADNVEIYNFDNDFAYARNKVATNIKTPWILFLDGHEYVKENSINPEILNTDADALLCTVEMDDGSSFRSPRIYRNYLKFKGAIHEQVQCIDPKPYPSFVIKHDRINSQDENSIKARHAQTDKMVPEILKKKLLAQPDDIRSIFHLALYYQGRNNMSEALKYQKMYLKYSKNIQENWFILFNRAILFLNNGRPYRALISATYADQKMHNRWETQKLLALIMFNLKKYSSSRDYFIKALEKNKFDTVFNPWQKDDSQTFNFIGETYFVQKDYHNAHEAFYLASQNVDEPKLKEFLKARSDLMLKMSKAQ